MDYREQKLIQEYGDNFYNKLKHYRTAFHIHLGYVSLKSYDEVNKQFLVEDVKKWKGYVPLVELSSFVL